MALFKRNLSEEEKEALEVKPMEDDEMGDVNGGYVFMHMNFDKGITEYQVIDDKSGEVLASHQWIKEAERDCRQRGLSDEFVSWTTVDRLRNDYKAACEREAEERRANIEKARGIILP